MNAATCAILAGVFPLILIAVVADRRNVHLTVRRKRWYRRAFIVTITFCILGLAYGVIGVQLDGFGRAVGVSLWVIFGLVLVAFTVSILLTVATQENEEDEGIENIGWIAAKSAQLNPS